MTESTTKHFEKKGTEIDSFLEEAKLIGELSLHSLSEQRTSNVAKKQVEKNKEIVEKLEEIKRIGFQGDLESFLSEKSFDNSISHEEQDLYGLVFDFVTGKSSRGSIDDLKKSVENIRKTKIGFRKPLYKKKEISMEVKVKEKQEKILINEILKTGKGGFYMSLPRGLSSSSGGFTTVNDRELRIRPPIISSIDERMENGKDKSVELIKFSLVKEYITEKKIVTAAKKGFLGFGKKEATSQNEIIGERIKKFSDIVGEVKKNESAYLLSYLFTTSHYLNGVDNTELDKDNAYIDHSHRPGQILSCNIYLPESLMNELKKNILEENGIKLLRKLVKFYLEKKFADNNKTGFLAAWETGEKNNGIPLKPPYEYWDTKGLKPLFIEGIELSF